MQTGQSDRFPAVSGAKRSAIYTRSFQAKVLREKPLEVEVEHCKTYCTTWRYSINNDQIYYEVQLDGDEQGQPELSRLLAATKRGCIDVVVRWLICRC